MQSGLKTWNEIHTQEIEALKPQLLAKITYLIEQLFYTQEQLNMLVEHSIAVLLKKHSGLKKTLLENYTFKNFPYSPEELLVKELASGVDCQTTHALNGAGILKKENLKKILDEEDIKCGLPEFHKLANLEILNQELFDWVYERTSRRHIFIDCICKLHEMNSLNTQNLDILSFSINISEMEKALRSLAYTKLVSDENISIISLSRKPNAAVFALNAMVKGSIEVTPQEFFCVDDPIEHASKRIEEAKKIKSTVSSVNISQTLFATQNTEATKVSEEHKVKSPQNS
jgi:hypothetical protein